MHLMYKYDFKNVSDTTFVFYVIYFWDTDNCNQALTRQNEIRY